MSDQHDSYEYYLDELENESEEFITDYDHELSFEQRESNFLKLFGDLCISLQDSRSTLCPKDLQERQKLFNSLYNKYVLGLSK